MKFKKAIICLLCAVMSLSMLACGGIDMPDGGTGTPDGIVITSKTYTVTFNGNGAPNPDPIQVGEGKALGAMLPAPTRSGYSFVGWFDSSNKQYTGTTKITGHVELTAKWESNAARLEYDNNTANWARSGHLYIHYKRAAHLESEQVNPPAGGMGAGAPLYSTASSSTVYGDWGLWAWPKNGEGRTFNPAWIDESGAVYDIDLTRDYHDAGWNGTVVPGVPLTNEMNYKEVTQIGTQLFKLSSRQSQGFWSNDGGNNYIKFDDARRSGGDYHWYVSEGKVGKGTPTYTGEVIEDVYGKIPVGSATTATSGVGIINSLNDSPYQKWTAGVQGFDANTGYQIFIASFCDSDGDGMGDIPGIISKLDYLDSLNVDMLWLTPFQTSTNYHGYDIDDYFSVDSKWGTAADYKELVTKAHQKGMKVVMDFVLNHTSEANEWFVKSKNLVKESASEVDFELSNTNMTEVDYRNFYSWINEEQYQALHSCTADCKKDNSTCPKKQWFKDEHDYYYYSSFGSSMPELNYDYQPVRDAILDICYQWMDNSPTNPRGYGLDGFRLDAVKHIYMVNEVVGKGGTCSATLTDNDITAGKSGVVSDGLYSHDQIRNYNFYREFNYRLKSKYPNAFVVGENLDGWNARIDEYYQGIDSQFEFNTYYASRGFATIRGITSTWGGSTNASWMGATFTTALASYDLYKKVNPKFIGGYFTSNHDLPRARNRMALSKTNGSTDDWYAEIKGNLIDDSYNALFLYYGMVLTMPGVSWIYYGDEIGMEGIMQYTLDTGSTDSLTSSPHEDRVYRQPMKWGGYGGTQTSAGYSIGYDKLKCELTGLNATSSVRSVQEQVADQTSLWNWVKTLTDIRKTYKLGTATAMTGSGSGSTISYTVTGGNGQKIKVTITSAAAAAGGNHLASKTVKIGSNNCGVVVDRA